jgi:hypothetical protein
MKLSFTSTIATNVKTLFNMQKNTTTKNPQVTEEELTSLKEGKLKFIVIKYSFIY